MSRSTRELAEVFHRYGDAYRQQAGAACSTAQRRVMAAIETCRTAARGGHVEQCDACGHQRIAYDSCRNRHCPKCQSLARAEWVAHRHAELLDTEYFHVVFTVPASIAAIAFQNKAVVYGIFFRATTDTLRTIAADPPHLGADIGGLAVLHTWSQTLVHHPHVHCLIPGGGLSPDRTRWVSCRPGFFLPVRVLSRLFRRLVLAALQTAFEAGQVRCTGTLAALADSKTWTRTLAATRQIDWVVYAKPPCAGPEQVLEYVGRYTHRIALSNDRLLDVDGGQVRFRYRDSRATTGARRKTMTLAAPEFIRRFLLHVLPTGFHRIRSFGFLANRHRRDALARCRSPLGPSPAPSTAAENSSRHDDAAPVPAAVAQTICPACQHGRLILVEYLTPDRCCSVIPDTS
jgi:hypothetical protein